LQVGPIHEDFPRAWRVRALLIDLDQMRDGRTTKDQNRKKNKKEGKRERGGIRSLQDHVKEDVSVIKDQKARKQGTALILRKTRMFNQKSLGDAGSMVFPDAHL